MKGGLNFKIWERYSHVIMTDLMNETSSGATFGDFLTISNAIWDISLT